LAGGTDLALQLGHRLSRDLDLFTPTAFVASEVAEQLRELEGFTVTRLQPGTILGTIPGTSISLFEYRYPLIAPTLNYQGVSLASLIGLGAMKLSAVADRGLRRDFVDLAILLDQFTLPELLVAYDRKFGALASNEFHLLKSLVYFDDAEADEPPDMLIEGYEWSQVKATIESAVRSLRP